MDVVPADDHEGNFALGEHSVLEGLWEHVFGSYKLLKYRLIMRPLTWTDAVGMASTARNGRLEHDLLLDPAALLVPLRQRCCRTTPDEVDGYNEDAAPSSTRR